MVYFLIYHITGIKRVLFGLMLPQNSREKVYIMYEYIYDFHRRGGRGNQHFKEALSANGVQKPLWQIWCV